ncbi:MAG: hypothetical protein IAG13_37355, partial [Deltaproteobacteria bacterium]|nr:hypothetical protein [Nannocystaceae bacterium]
MTQWATLREQWLAWAEEPHVARSPCTALDAFDDELRTVLNAAPFGQRIEVTQIARLGESMPFDSIPTLVRGSEQSASSLLDDLEDDDPDAASTLVHGARFHHDEPAPAQLEVALQTPGGGLQIELESAPPSDAQAAWYIPALTGSARAAAEDARQPPAQPQLDTGGTVIAPAPTSPSGTIQIDPASTFGAEPPMAFAASPIMSEPVPVRSGTTLIPIDGEAGSSRTAGVIDVQTVTEPPPPPRRPSKIVVAPPIESPDAVVDQAPLSALTSAYDESGEFPRVSLEDPASENSEGIGELEPELIESADLIESVESVESVYALESIESIESIESVEPASSVESSRESPPRPPSPRISGQMRAVDSPPPPPRAESSGRAEPGPPPAPPPR